jgi:putative ABC transport system permease protein
MSQDVDFTLADPTPTRSAAETVVADVEQFVGRLKGDPLTSTYFQSSSRLDHFVSRSDLVRDSLRPPVLPITAAGVAVGLLVVGAAGVFWALRRRRELTVLAAHGVPAAALGIKALAEALPALVVGSVAAWAAAVALVRRAGPSPVLDGDAVPRAAVAATAAFVVIIVVVAAIAAVRCRSLTDAVHPHRRLRPLALPWELTLVAAGVALWYRLDDSREQTSEAFGAVARIPAKLLVVPILVIVGVAAFGCRLGTRWLRRRAVRPRSTRRASRRPAAFLAARRIAREPTIAAALAAATAVPIALAAYGATVTGSVQATLAAEARLFVGADVVLTLTEPAPIPPALAGRATEVLRVNAAAVGGIQTDLLLVDPGTFGHVAFWDGQPGGRSLAEVTQLLAGGGAVAARPVQGGEQPLKYLGQELTRVDVTSVEVLPAARGGYPTTLIARDRLDLADRGTPQLWVRGDADQVLRAAHAAGLPLAWAHVAEELYANTVFAPLTYTFAYLAALSLLTGMITLVGLLLYLESRAPVHRRGFALMRRMGLREASHRRALALELTTPLLTGLAGGTAIAACLVAPLVPEFEVNPYLPPGTVLAVPLPAILGTATAVALIAVIAIGYAQRRLGRASPGEVLRDVNA